MKRRADDAGPGPERAHFLAQEAAWWAARAEEDQGLTRAEWSRYRGLVDQQDHVGAAVDAIHVAAFATPEVARSLSEFSREAHARATRRSLARLDRELDAG